MVYWVMRHSFTSVEEMIVVDAIDGVVVVVDGPW